LTKKDFSPIKDEKTKVALGLNQKKKKEIKNFAMIEGKQN